MASYTKIIGDIGVSVIISEFLKHGINVLLPYDDNSPYDLVIYVNSKFHKIQVKTTEKVKSNGTQMQFEITKSNPYSKTDPRYLDGEVDYFALYCIENEWCGLFAFNEYKPNLTIRLKDTKNGQTKNIKFAKDYDFHDQVIKFFNKRYIKENITHTEEKKEIKRRNRKTKLCPVCNINKIAPYNSMCRSCYISTNSKYNNKNIIFDDKNNKKIVCPICNENYMSITSQMCNACRIKERAKDIPEEQELKQLLGVYMFDDICKKYDKPPCTIRRWYKKYKLPYTRSEIDKLVI